MAARTAVYAAKVSKRDRQIIESDDFCWRPNHGLRSRIEKLLPPPSSLTSAT